MITSELRTEGGRTLVVKRADPTVAVDAARLTREATMLAMARHPGVVEMAEQVDPDEHPEHVELRTIFAGARTLAASDLDSLTVARALAATAGTVADLHALGLVHGRIDPGHIVLTGSGRAVLCGFAEAGLAGDLRSDGQVLVPSLDVAALGALLHRAVADAAASPDPRRSGLDRPAAARLADRATAADPALRPSARTFAAGLAACLPAPPSSRTRARPSLPAEGPSVDRSPVDRSSAEPTGPARPAPPAAPASGSVSPAAAGSAPRPAGPAPSPVDRDRRRRGRRVLAVTGVVLAVVSLGLGVDALVDLRSGPGADPAGASPTRASPTSAGASVPVEQPSAGAPQPGGQLEIDGRHLALGTAEDQVLQAVWGCTGSPTVVLVRPDGSVFRFDRLATPGQDVSGVLVGRVPDRAAVQVVSDADGCLALQARAGDRIETLSIPAAPPSPTPA